jgi:LmbE family N-acetylglucosaminyl deacetylase
MREVNVARNFPAGVDTATSHTIVFFHAHPDDEALLTGGTMARLAAEGHRVVLVTATAGEAGLASSALTAARSLAARRRDELARAAGLLGCAKVVVLGYADSGMADDPSGADGVFADADVDQVAERLADILRAESAEVLTIYDPAGGYGHPDHIQVHHVGRRAADLANTPVVLEATVDRRALQRALRSIRWLTARSPDLNPARFDSLYSDPSRVTHRVNVSRYLNQKRAAMRSHASQATADDGTRLLAGLLRLPKPLFRLALGHEWFVEHDRERRRRPLDDVLATMR